MRALLERSRTARTAVTVLAFGAVLGLARAAVADGDLGLRRDTQWLELQPAAPVVDAPVAAVHHRHARRIWAASRSRPLRIKLARHRHRTWIADRHRDRPRVAIDRRRRVVATEVVFPRLMVLPKPPRPALVSIYQDRTLRAGDAVMMEDGIHVFRGAERGAHRPGDFVRLSIAAALDWHLRQTLDVLDRNPPTRWSSIGTTAG